MTYNLLYRAASDPAEEGGAGTWRQRRQLVDSIIREYQPDIVGFQEVQPEQLDELKAIFDDYDAIDGPVNGVSRWPLWTRCYAPPLALAGGGLRYWSKSKALRTTGGVLLALAGVLVANRLVLERAKGSALQSGGHCPIFYCRDRFRAVEHGTFWVSEKPEQPDSVLIGTWLPRIVNWARLEDRSDGKRFTVFNAHLDWWIVARWRSGGIVAQRMNRQWDGSPQIILGDFNAPRESPTYEKLIEYSQTAQTPLLHDAWQEAAQRSGPDETYHGGDGQTGWPGCIDHILFRPAAKVTRAVAATEHDGPIYPSDHFPVQAEINFSS